MAASLSGHLIDSFLTAQQRSRGPFGQNTPANPAIAVYGAMSFAPQMHGSFSTTPRPPIPVDLACQDISEQTAKQIAALQAKLNKKLGPEYISQRPGPGGGPKLTYAEGWKVINLANEVFGFNGWSSSIVSLSTDYIDFNEQSQRYNVGVTAVVRVTLRDGVFHEDTGYGLLENSKSKGAALDKCKKEAVTDGLKRALRNFGNLLGNCLYDKAYTQEVIKIKVAPPKFDPSELHRRPECDPNRNDAGPRSLVPGTSSSTFTPVGGLSGTNSCSATNQSAAQSTPPPPPARSTSGLTASSNNLAKGTSSMGLADQNVASRPMNASTSGPVKPPTNQAIQTSTNQPQQPQKPKLAPRTVYEPKPPPPQTVSASASTSAIEKRVSFVPAPQSSVVGLSVVSPSQPEPPAAQAKTESYEEEESFGLDSEDDAFFATVDLGEAAADTGRPLDHDGLGGLGDFDMTNCSLSDIDIEEGPSVLGGHKPPIAAVVVPQQQQQQPSRPSVPQQSRLGQQQRFPRQSGNSARHQSGSSSSNQPTRTSQTSSGAFHFPVELNNQSGKPPSGLSAGVKRPADAIRESPARRPAQGMGLSHVSSGRREPLATLEVADGGDVKRVRR